MSDYGFEKSWSEEQHRLALIEHCWDPATTGLLAELGVGTGWQCLEVGAGNGSIARWLRDIVGPEGRVLAFDIDTRLFADEPGIEVRQGNLLTDEIEPGAFDLVHCRALLHHLPGQQVHAVRRLMSALRPGGLFVASEPWLGPLFASQNAYGAAWRALDDVIPADYEWAVSLSQDLQAAGLVGVEMRANTDVVQGGTPLAKLATLTIEAARGRMPEETDLEAVSTMLDDPGVFVPAPVWYSAWGRRPDTA